MNLCKHIESKIEHLINSTLERFVETRLEVLVSAKIDEILSQKLKEAPNPSSHLAAIKNKAQANSTSPALGQPTYQSSNPRNSATNVANTSSRPPNAHA